MMTTDEINRVLNLVVQLEASNDNNDVVFAITEFIKESNPHSLTCKSLLDLEEVLSDHFNSMNYWDDEEIDAAENTPSIYSL